MVVVLFWVLFKKIFGLLFLSFKKCPSSSFTYSIHAIWHTYSYRHIYAYIHTLMCTYTHMHTHTCMCTHTPTKTFMCTYTHAHTHTCMCMHTHTQKHTHTYMCSHTHKHTHIHTYTITHLMHRCCQTSESIHTVHIHLTCVCLTTDQIVAETVKHASHGG